MNVRSVSTSIRFRFAVIMTTSEILMSQTALQSSSIVQGKKDQPARQTPRLIPDAARHDARPDLPGPGSGRLRGMLRKRIMTRGVNATAFALAVALLTFIPGRAALAQGVDAAAAPDEGDAIAAYLKARRWVDAFDTPQAMEPGASVPLRNTSAVCVILRHRGRIISIGEGDRGARMLRDAVSDALGAALGDEIVQSFPAEFSDQLGRRFTLEIQFAGDPEPLPGRTFAEMGRQIRPGLDGMAFRSAVGRGPDAQERWVRQWPCRALASNAAAEPARQAPAIISRFGMPPHRAEAAVQRGDVGVYRFRTFTLGQTTADGAPYETVRGDTVVVVRDEEAAIRETGKAIAARLVAARWPNETLPGLGLRGTYFPHSDRYDPPAAPPTEQAMAAFALRRYARLALGETAGAERELLDATARAILADLALVTETEADPYEREIACAFMVLAILEVGPSRRAPVEADMLKRAAATVRAAFTEAGELATSGGVRAPVFQRSPVLHAAGVAALARLATTGPERLRPTRATVAGAMTAVMARAPGGQVVGLFPWLVLATQEVAPTAAQAKTIATALDAVVAAQADFVDLGPQEQDLAGGYRLSGTRADQRPTAQSLRPATAIAAAWGEASLTPAAGRESRADSIRRAVRFVRQLTVREATAARTPDAARARGGVRRSTWQSEMSVPNQALALLFLAEAAAQTRTETDQ